MRRPVLHKDAKESWEGLLPADRQLADSMVYEEVSDVEDEYSDDDCESVDIDCEINTSDEETDFDKIAEVDIESDTSEEEDNVFEAKSATPFSMYRPNYSHLSVKSSLNSNARDISIPNKADGAVREKVSACVDDIDNLDNRGKSSLVNSVGVTNKTAGSIASQVHSKSRKVKRAVGYWAP